MKQIIVLFCAFLAVFAQPDIIRINVPNLQPEGIEFSSETGFLVGSLSAGTVFKVADDGTITPFVQDAALLTSVGIQIDAQARLLYITNINFTAATQNQPGFQAGIVIAELDTGAVVNIIDLTNIGTDGRARFANDLIHDADGNIYVTDSLGAQIWKVTAAGAASTFVSNDAWNPLDTQFIGLNGIEIQEDFLIAGQSGLPGKLWKVPILANGLAGTPVEIQTDIPIRGIDGLTFAPNGNLFVVNNPEQLVYELQSSDKFQTAIVVAEGKSNFPTPTTLAFANNSPFVVHAYFADVPTYEIEKINMVPRDFGAAGQLIFNGILVVIALISVLLF